MVIILVALARAAWTGHGSAWPLVAHKRTLVLQASRLVIVREDLIRSCAQGLPQRVQRYKTVADNGSMLTRRPRTENLHGRPDSQWLKRQRWRGCYGATNIRFKAKLLYD